METFKIIGIHENLLRLVGCCTGAGPLYVILELCKHGNLRYTVFQFHFLSDFLRAHRPRDEATVVPAPDVDYLEPSGRVRARRLIESETAIIKNLTQRHLVQFAWQVAKGMEYLASRKVWQAFKDILRSSIATWQRETSSWGTTSS